MKQMIKQSLLEAKQYFNPKDNFLHFLLNENSNFIPALHNILLCEKLMHVEQGKIQRLIISMPPRHGKSHAVSRFAAWYLMKHPDEEVLLTSYSASLASKFSREARRAVNDLGYIFKVLISREKSGVECWELEGKKGVFNSAPIGGQITGKGAHLAIIDDPLKNDKEAFSRTIKDNIWDWWQSTLKTRLYNDSKVILVLTRWAVDDLAGRILEAIKQGEEDEWEVLELKAIAEDNDILRRKPGETLWPEKFSLSYLNSIKQSISSYFWSALYQQSPRPEDCIFKYEWLRFCSPVEYEPGQSFKDEKVVYTVMSIDPAISEKQTADYTVIMTADITNKNNIIIRNIWRGRVNFPVQLQKIVEKFQKYKPHYVFVEEVGFQKAIRQALNQEGYFIPFKPVKQTNNKYLRINAISPFFENGRIYLRDGMKDFINEYLDFPSGKHDDILDALEMIVSNMSVGGLVPEIITTARRKSFELLQGYNLPKFKGRGSITRGFI